MYSRTLAGLILIVSVCLTAAVTPSTAAEAAPIRATRTTPATVKTYRYDNNSRAQNLDAYYDTSAKGRPWIMVIHGGSWYGGSKHGTLSAVRAFRKAGFAVFNISYRLSGEAAWPAQRVDAATALKWIKAHSEKFGIDPGRGAVYGFSAGGHIAAHLGTAGSGGARTNAVLTVSGVNDPYRGWRYAYDRRYARSEGVVWNKRMIRVAKATKKLLGRTTPKTNWPRWHAAIPGTRASAGDAPFLMYHALDDRSVGWGQSEALRRKLTTKGAQATLVQVRTGGHTQRILFDNPARRASAIAWLKRQTA